MSVTVLAGATRPVAAGARRDGEKGIEMRNLFVSFGPDAGYLMERLLKLAAAGKVGDTIVKVRPEGDDAVLEMLREAGAGGRIIELMDREDVPGTGEGLVLRLREVRVEGMSPATLVGEDQDDDSGLVWVGLHNAERVHFY